ncbi:molybdopterin oxidoreductase family protein [Acidianus ambivalens]|uniref:Molybdopterin-dependent oxidoreductase n=1 Tax=Acidianus ambivalens TaxID=2283 RepID=A0A650CWE7_ACIAM|nr:molybdopterin-dependent oxidoreductase [Acidianus ambivalens]MQL54341.1 molybdopterin-dependent oxidoreductase [Acidianus ambivalens]QGR22166.1 molybdopterin-dependent oxidoreductase [Acidianus ambivalens]
MKTICPYCGIGCGVEFEKDRITPTKYITNKGMMCIKAALLPDTLKSKRLINPTLDGKEIDLDNALSVLSTYIRRNIKKYSKNSIAFYMGAQIPTEDQYLFVKLGKGFIGTGVFDSNVRLCMASAAYALKYSFGYPLPTANYDDIDKAETLFIIGANPASSYPVLWNQMLHAKNSDKDKKIIVIDPVLTETAEHADYFIKIPPGGDIILLYGLIYYLISKSRNIDQIENIEDLKNIAMAWYPSKVSQLLSIDEKVIRDVAERIINTNTVFMWGMGINQRSYGTDLGILIATMAMLTDNVYGEGKGVLPLTGQHNSMGAREIGALAGMLPGLRYVDNEDQVREVEDFWQIPRYTISRNYYTITEFYELMEERKIKVLWIIGTNPVISLPRSNKFKELLSYVDLVVTQDAYETETVSSSDMVIPVATWSERAGIHTTGDRTVSYMPKIRESNLKADYEIAKIVGEKLNFKMNRDIKDIFDELVKITENTPVDYKGIRYGEFSGYKQSKYKPIVLRTKAVEPNYSLQEGFVLITGRLLALWNTKYRNNLKLIMINDIEEDEMLISEEDAKELGIKTGDIVEISTRENSLIFRAKTSNRLSKGIIFVPFHWGKANSLMDWKIDKISKEPAFKEIIVSSIKVVKS